MKRNQLTISYPERDATQLEKTVELLRLARHINVSAFCREAIAEKIERLEQGEAIK